MGFPIFLFVYLMNSPIALFPFHISSFVPKEVEISELQAMSMTVHRLSMSSWRIILQHR